MASGSGRPLDRPGVVFRINHDIPWNELNTIGLPDVLGLHAWRPGTAVIQVLTGRDSRSVRALIPDDNVVNRGYHDVTVVDMDHVDGPNIPVADLDILRGMWPLPVVSSKTDKQMDLVLLRHTCKKRYRGTRICAGFVERQSN